MVDPPPDPRHSSASPESLRASSRDEDVSALRAALLRHLGEQADVYPTQLEQRFPHVLARVVELWGTLRMDAYLQSLLVSDRPSRKGFPAEVAKEIFRISVIHGALGLTKDPIAKGWNGVTDREIERWHRQKT